MSKVSKKAWVITLKSPDDNEMILVNNEEFKTISAFTERINLELKPYNIKYSVQTIRKYAAGRYCGGEGTLAKILTVKKLIRKPIVYETIVDERKKDHRE